MKDIFEQLSERAKNVSLSAEEKQGIRAQLVSFAHAHPVRNETPVRQIVSDRKIIPPRRFSYHFFNLNLRPMFIALVIALVLGGSTAFAAENSLPGDTLYPVKVYVNEQLRDVLEVSDKGQAEWNLQKVERRLLEAEKLAQQDKLNVATRSDIEARIKTNIDNAIELRDRDINTNNSDETKDTLTANLGALIRAHGEILESILSHTVLNGSRSELESILNSIRSHTTTTINISTESEDESDDNRDLGTAESAAGKLQAAERKLAEVEKFVSNKLGSVVNTSTVSVSLETKVRVLLQQSKDLIVEGKTKVAAGAYRDAFNLFRSSMELSQEAKILVATAHELKINLREDQDEEVDNSDDQGGDQNEKNTASTDSRGKTDDRDEDKRGDKSSVTDTIKVNVDDEDTTEDKQEDEDKIELKVEVESREGNDSIRVKLDD